MGLVQVGLRLDAGLLARVDVARGDVSRTRWVTRALEAALGREASVSEVGLRLAADRVLEDRLSYPAGTVAAAELVLGEQRAVEQALSDAKEPSEREQAGPGSVPPSVGGVRPAAPAEQSEPKSTLTPFSEIRTSGASKRGVAPVPKKGEGKR